jgi:hypothetical protein
MLRVRLHFLLPHACNSLSLKPERERKKEREKEREKKREKGKEKEREGERGGERGRERRRRRRRRRRERERERERDVEYGCFIFIFKGMTGAFAPFSYLVSKSVRP